MGFFIDLPTTAECVLIALFFAALSCLATFRTLGILQSLGYSGKSLFKWALKRSNLAGVRYSLLAFAQLLSCGVVSLCFSFAGAHWAGLIGMTGFAVFFILFVYADCRRTTGGVPVVTARFKRLFLTEFLVTALLVYIAAALLNFVEYLWGNELFAIVKYCSLAVFPFAAIALCALANLISLIWEKPIAARHVKNATDVLRQSGLKTVAVTGSCGKTSAKNILAAMLKGKYRVLATPASYNTPLGIARTVNGAQLENYDLFIAEMGARHPGDIEELCKICPPDYSLITAVCPQHLATFKTLDNVAAAKGEVIAATKNVCVVSSACTQYYKDKERVILCEPPEDIVATPAGVRFKINLGGERVELYSKLLGEHSARNVAACARLAYELGIPVDQIKEAAASLSYVEHRLQLIQNNGVNILDDGYNSNVDGAREAVEVLKSFEGKKIIVTPGLVELGVLEESENQKLGSYLVGLDYVILVGETLVQCIKRGYLAAGGDENSIKIVPSLVAAQEELKGKLGAGDTVLFLNDLPEVYR